MNQEDKTTILAHKIALNPNKQQLNAIRRAAEVARYAYNWRLEEGHCHKIEARTI
jgi:hypothetical protein